MGVWGHIGECEGWGLRLETETNHVGNQSNLHDGALIKKTEQQDSEPSWLATLCSHYTSMPGKGNITST